MEGYTFPEYLWKIHKWNPPIDPRVEKWLHTYSTESSPDNHVHPAPDKLSSRNLPAIISRGVREERERNYISVVLMGLLYEREF